MKVFNKLAVATVGLVLGMAAASPAQAAILGASEGGMIIDAPDTTAINANVSDLMQGFNEKQNVLLEKDLEVDFGKFIAAGTEVNSHMIFLDSVGNTDVSQTVEWLFDGDILGIMSDAPGLLEANSNSILGAEGTEYGSFKARGLEGGKKGERGRYTLDGNKLNLKMTVTSPGDWIRVVTKANPTQSVPEPASILGLLAVGAFGTTSTLKRKKKQEA
jgi:hypothetical protein